MQRLGIMGKSVRGQLTALLPAPTLCPESTAVQAARFITRIHFTVALAYSVQALSISMHIRQSHPRQLDPEAVLLL